MDIDKCVICGEPVKYYKPYYCCDGSHCGCHGEPDEPPVCDNEKCQDEMFGHEKTSHSNKNHIDNLF